MTDEQSGNLNQPQEEEPRKKTAREWLEELGFINMTRPGSGTAFIGGKWSPKQPDGEE